MEKVTINLSMNAGEKTVAGYAYSSAGIDFVLHKHQNGWRASDVKTGLAASRADRPTRRACAKALDDLLKNPGIVSKIKEHHSGVRFPTYPSKRGSRKASP